MSDKGLVVGAPAPDWQLKDLNGRRVQLAQFRGKPLLLFFFRGTWCPNCRKQMEQISSDWNTLSSLANVVGIVAQGQKEVADFLTRNPLPFRLLPDPEREIVKLYGVYQLFGLDGFRIAHPTTIIINPTGMVTYCYVGQSMFDRPDPNEVLAQLRSLKAVV